MSIVLMRKLTAKSLIGFGRYTDLTIQRTINVNNVSEVEEVYLGFTGRKYSEFFLENIRSGNFSAAYA